LLQLDLILGHLLDRFKWFLASIVDVLLDLFNGAPILLLPEYVFFLLVAEHLGQVLRPLTLLAVKLVILLAEERPILGWYFKSQVLVCDGTFLFLALLLQLT
jgi:hypothetical protein